MPFLLSTFVFAGLGIASPIAMLLEAGDLDVNATRISERQTACGQWSPEVTLVGDGNPHTVYFDSQVSNTLACDPNGGGNSCSSGYSQSFSISLNANLGGALGWISGGFGVTTTWSTSSAETCSSDTAENVCVWYNGAYTAYTVQNTEYNDCTGYSDYGGTSVITAPNDNNAGGGGFYCVYDTCRDEGSGYWH